MFNLSETEARQFHRDLIGELEKIEARHYTRWLFTIKNHYNLSARAIRNDKYNKHKSFNAFFVDTRDALERNVRECINFFSQYTLDEYSRSQKSAVLRKDFEGIFNPKINQWASAYAIIESSKITSTTVEMIDVNVQNGILRGMDKFQLATMLQDEVGPVVSPTRARAISQTESHTAMNKTIIESVRGIGDRFRKFWLSTIDDRTRGGKTGDRFNHIDAHGQEKAMGEYFNVSGERLMFPGDPMASPGNRIRCRCVMTFNGF